MKSHYPVASSRRAFLTTTAASTLSKTTARLNGSERLNSIKRFKFCSTRSLNYVKRNPVMLNPMLCFVPLPSN